MVAQDNIMGKMIIYMYLYNATDHESSYELAMSLMKSLGE